MDNIGNGYFILLLIVTIPSLTILSIFTIWLGWLFLWMFITFSIGMYFILKITKNSYRSGPILNYIFEPRIYLSIVFYLSLTVSYYIWTIPNWQLTWGTLALYALIWYILYKLSLNYFIWYARFLKRPTTAIPIRFKPSGSTKSMNNYSRAFDILYKKGCYSSVATILHDYLYSPSRLTDYEKLRTWFFKELNKLCSHTTNLKYSLCRSYTMGQLDVIEDTNFMTQWCQEISPTSKHQLAFSYISEDLIPLLEGYVQNPKFLQSRNNRGVKSRCAQANFLAAADCLSSLEFKDSKIQDKAQHLASLMFIVHGMTKNM
ncbi:MAG: hypothetical protein GY810_19525 [Aureispira sp.]|nr:hypothetical protein [Aureispira sp.]